MGRRYWRESIRNKMNSRHILLDKFRDNTGGQINASDLRIFVNAVYDEMLLLEKLLDRDDVFEIDKAATINQVSLLRDTINQMYGSLDNIYTKDTTYSIQECNENFYTQDQIRGNFYTKDQIDKMLSGL